jgi:phosphogluconate dehydratase
VWGDSFADFASEPQLRDGTLSWRPAVAESLDSSVLASVAEPFSAEGGLNLISGNLGRGVVKLSAVASQHRLVEAPALVLENQDDLAALFEAGQLDRDVIVVARFQGPKALGMPELHKLTPLLGSLQDRGFKVALVTDGRMSGASGKVPAAIHLVPEAAAGGPLARVHSGDLLRLDADAGTLEWLGDSAELAARQPVVPPRLGERGVGRELFALCRQAVSSAEHGASYLFGEDD